MPKEAPLQRRWQMVWTCRPRRWVLLAVLAMVLSLMLAQGRSVAQLPTATLALPNYSPGVSGFQFSNAELAQAMNLQANRPQWEALLSQQLKELFGDQVCVGQSSTHCLLTTAAQNWLNSRLRLMQQGTGDGMAAGSLALWQPTPRPWWQRLLGLILRQAVYRLSRDLVDLQAFIANLFLLQAVDEVRLPTQQIRETFSPTQILQEIINTFRTAPQDPYTLGIYRSVAGQLTAGHSLTPYRVEDKGGGKYWLYVYDSNYPTGRSQPAAPYVEFDTRADTWRYQPVPTAAVFSGSAGSKNLDLTKLSWRQPHRVGEQVPPGQFTCPFCSAAPSSPALSPEPAAVPAAGLEISLIGEGRLTLQRQGAETGPLLPETVPFKGGLERAVPATYHLPASALDQPLQLTLSGPNSARSASTMLQISGPGYSASVENLTLGPEERLTLLLLPSRNGPELTLVADQPRPMPTLAIYLEDFTERTRFDLAGDRYAAIERNYAKSASFQLSGSWLQPGEAAAIAVNLAQRRLYFGGSSAIASTYRLSLKNNLQLKDRMLLTADSEDAIVRTALYEEATTLSNITLAAGHQAYLDYRQNLIEPGQTPYTEFINQLLAADQLTELEISTAALPLATRFRLNQADTQAAQRRLYRNSVSPSVVQ